MPARQLVLAVPLVIVGVMVLGPLLVSFVISFWERTILGLQPGFTLDAYVAFFSGIRLQVLLRSLAVALSATVLMLLLAYPLAYLIAYKIRPNIMRAVLFLFAVPFLVNYIIRAFSWSYILGRNGPINNFLVWTGFVESPIDWLLFSDFAVYLGLVAAYMPFMIYPIWLALHNIERRYLEASWVLGEPPWRTFVRVTLPLSMPGVFAASIFGFVSSFGEVAVSVILGGVGYQLMGNTIASALDVLNYPLAAAMSTSVVACMLLLIVLWYCFFDVRVFLGRLIGRA